MQSIKSKIVTMTVSLSFAFGLVIVCAALMAFYRDKELIIKANNAEVATFEGQMNTEIAELEKNALDLALIGEFYFQKSKQQPVGEFFARELLKNYPHTMGNGIWFEPYKTDPTVKANCIHALWDENGKIAMLPSCAQGVYNYFERNWYAEIIKDLKAGKKIAWSRPYKSSEVEFLMTTVGVGIYNGDELLGMAMADWELDTILKSILKIKPTPNSFVLFADKLNDYVIATTEPGVDNDAVMGKSLSDIKWYSRNIKNGVAFEYNGKKYIPYIKQLKNGFFLIVNIPALELFGDAVLHLWILLGVLLTSTLVIVFALYRILTRNINQPIDILMDIAQHISQGDLERTIRLAEPYELAKLANAFNKMKTDMKTHLTELAKISGEKERMESELAIAQTIQSSALPKDFPQNEYYALNASMTPAREVGGDFYDFFPIDENRIGLVMADVCGKGITAALYMMSAKTIIKNMLQAGYPLKEAIDKANISLCNSSAPLMFVTAFIGILDLRTGEVEFINAGHCPPLLQTKKEYKYLDVIKNMVLGVNPAFDYKVEKITLQENDRLFLYTDGVTEAQTEEREFLGEKRLLKILNQKEVPVSETLEYVYKSIQEFIKGAPQFDDITMLIVEFHHKKD